MLSPQEELAQLNETVAALYQQGNYGEATECAARAVEVSRHMSSMADFAACLSNLAGLYRLGGDYAKAEPLCKQVLEIDRVRIGEEHPDFAQSLNELGLLYQQMGDYPDAESYFKQAMEIQRRVLGEEHPHFAASLNNLGGNYLLTGDYATARPLFAQALEIRIGTLGEEHPLVAESLNNLGHLYELMGDYLSAENLLKQALEIKYQVLGDQHPSVAQTLSNLALVYHRIGSYVEALSFCEQALDIRSSTLGEENPLFAQSLNNLGMLYRDMGDYAASIPIIEETLKICSLTFGEQHPDFSTCLNNLGQAYAATGRETQALEIMEQSIAIDDKMIGQLFSIGSEKQRTYYLETVRPKVDVFASLISQHLAHDPRAVRSALTLILRRKAIEAEVLATQRDALLGGRYPAAADTLHEISILRAQIAQKILTGAVMEDLNTHQQVLAQWNAQKELLEAKVARQVPEMNIEQKVRSIDCELVAKSLPAGATLVEFIRFEDFDFKAVPARGEAQWKPARYLAFVMPAGEPDNVEMLDLGEAEPIDKMIAALRDAITAVKDSGRGLGAAPELDGNTNAMDVGIRLCAAVFTPLLPAIGNRKRLMISPDGDLTRLPFEVLVTESGRRLIDDYKISYLSAGRDVVRFGFKSNGKPARPLVVADPDFDLSTKGVDPKIGAGAGRLSRAFKRGTRGKFQRLPGTRLEGEHIATMLDAELWTEGAALDARLKNCQSPRILHLATHGFFLEDQKRDPNAEPFGFGSTSFSEDGTTRLTGASFENPLLRSGLALAGVNTWLENGEVMEQAEDGLLTAEDVSGLDLFDTEMVVLSACETGLGEVRVGEGVFGLQRAFVLAGAKTLVMSLWEVPDETTQELMEDFYRRILDGESRADALRAAQLAIKAKHPEPLYWGAFICQGNSGPLAAF